MSELLEAHELEKYFDRAESILAPELANGLAAFYVDFVRNLTSEKYHEYGDREWRVGNDFFENAIYHGVTEFSTGGAEWETWTGLSGRLLEDIWLDILKPAVYLSIRKQLMQLPNVEFKSKGPEMFESVRYSYVEYEERYKSGDLTFLLKAYPSSIRWTISDATNQKIADESLGEKIRSWVLYKRTFSNITSAKP